MFMAKHGCDHAVHVKTVEGRYFIVEFDSEGEPLRIKERKTSVLFGHIKTTYNVAYWTASSHPLGTGNTIPKRVIAAAREKLRREHESIKNTP